MNWMRMFVCMCHTVIYPLVYSCTDCTVQCSLPFHSWLKLCDGKKNRWAFYKCVCFICVGTRTEWIWAENNGKGTGLEQWSELIHHTNYWMCIISTLMKHTITIAIENIQLNALILIRKSFYLFTVFSFFRDGFGFGFGFGS